MRYISISLMALLLGAGAAQAQGSQRNLVKVPIADAPSFAKRALVIGVHNYETVSGLNYTTNDARAFAELLRTKWRFPAEAITLMTDDPDTPQKLQPTYTRLRTAMKLLTKGINSQSEVVFFYSGHGVRLNDEDYLVPQDGNPDDVAGTCVSYTRLRQELETMRPHRATLIVDACRNLTGGKGTSSSGFGNRVRSAGPEIAELMSCQPTEISQEDDTFKQGVFTHFLLAGLNGDPEAISPTAKAVTFDSLKIYVQGKVSQYVEHTFNAQQTPDGRASLGAMVLAVPSRAPRIAWPPPTPVVRAGSIPNPPLTAINPKDGAEMIFIPPGEFTMGSNDGDPDEKPAHQVYLSGYWIYKNDVTAAQYLKFCQATGHPVPPDLKPDCPVYYVTWNDAKAYSEWARVDLPTEAQWEKAARGTDGRTYPWGNDYDDSRLACATDKTPTPDNPFPVGSFPGGASPYGCLDMAGNMFQWCADWYGKNYYQNSPDRDPTGPATGKNRVIRGHSFEYPGGVFSRASRRAQIDPGNEYYVYYVGFRCALHAGS